LQAVQVIAPRSLIGRIARVTVTEVGSNSLFGALSGEPQAPQLIAAGA
jgi:hypothetical protein